MRWMIVFVLAVMCGFLLLSCSKDSNPTGNTPPPVSGQDTTQNPPVGQDTTDTTTTPVIPPVNKIDTIVTPGSQDSLSMDSLTSNNTGVIANFGQNIDIGLVTSDTVSLKNLGGTISVDTLRSDSAAISATGGGVCSVSVSNLEAGAANLLTTNSGVIEIDSAIADSLSIQTTNSGVVNVYDYLNADRFEARIENKGNIEVGNASFRNATIEMQGSGQMLFDTVTALSQVNISTNNSGTLTMSSLSSPVLSIDTRASSTINLPSLQARKAIISGTTGNVLLGKAGIDTLIIQVGGLQVVEWDDGIPIITQVDGGQWQGYVKIDTLYSNYVVVAMRGSGMVEIAAGATQGQSVDLRASAEYLAGGLASANSTVTVGGASEATIRVSESLTVTMTESARVNYYGNPAVTSNASADSRLTDLDP